MDSKLNKFTVLILHRMLVFSFNSNGLEQSVSQIKGVTTCIYQDSGGSYKNNPNCKLNPNLNILYNFEMSARTRNLMPKCIMGITGSMP